MSDPETLITEHINKIGEIIWKIRRDPDLRLVELCSASSLLLFSQFKKLDKEAYGKAIELVFEALRHAAWTLWEIEHKRRLRCVGPES